MLKKSTLLSVSIFFLLFIGLSDYGYGCHKNDQPHGRHTDCNGGGPGPGGGGGDKVVGEYDVEIDTMDTDGP